MHPLKLYTTLACHLCEQAEALLGQTLDVSMFECERVDIITENALLQRYGTRIPVLVCGKSGQELSWPFDSVDIDRFTRRIIDLAI